MIVRTDNLYKQLRGRKREREMKSSGESGKLCELDIEDEQQLEQQMKAFPPPTTVNKPK
jgi:hypothetical protein